VLVGGLSGLVVGIVVAGGVERAVARLTPREERTRRDRLLADLPFAADLLVACLRAGTSPVQALEAVAAGVSGPLGDELASVAAALRLGADPSTAWARFLDQPDLAPFGRAMVRVWETGAPLADTLTRLADDARLARRTRAEQRARSVGVKAAAPLGLCFLPAFVLMGVVPLVASAVVGLLR
jgi:pilus assembly protein TadC